ncbi:hypothetical protein NCAS_0A08810 [Naumovozyma castellii]|uniref:Uncharacterized protein n=1 Tax=Naumovozyma castellii TaxID=27288 RepID=G0V7J1_NAUCA|nr:hypothetical protein NCAS_0A08810 [Naumovozyma castellii CBS 4309]CCC67439.1 hypothetical protein NCAS_0A08810 [Naumovozyma castellii CBS 4309]
MSEDLQDLETQPLLQPLPVPEEAPAEATPTETHRRTRTIVKTICSLAVLAVILLVYSISTMLPSKDEIQNSIIKMSQVEVLDVQLDGWTDNGGETLDNEFGRELQMSSNVSFKLDYDKMTMERREWFEWLSQKVIKTVCVDLNDMEILDSDAVLGSVTLKRNQPICVDLRNEVLTDLHLTILIEPDMDNVLKVIKKIWNHDYDELKLWSRLDATFFKSGQFGTPKISMTDLRIDLNSVLDWERELQPFIEYFRDITKNVEIETFSMTDLSDGFFIRSTSQKFQLPKNISWLSLPEDASVPKLSWDVRLPDCSGDYTIELEELECLTDPLLISGDSFTAEIEGSLNGPLPDSLLTQVCDADEQDTVTPLTLLLNKLLNETEQLTIEVKGSIIENDGKHQNSDSIIPSHILDKALDYMSYFPLSSNTTFNTSSLIKEFDIDDLKLKWVPGLNGDKRLSVVGTITGYLDLSFYETVNERLSVNKIKGKLDLFHNDNHFLIIPMPVWINSTSTIFHDEGDGKTVMELTFDIQNNEIEVTDRFELGKCFNEILFKGETKVHFENVLDIVVDSMLGEIVLLGLQGEGDTVVH